MRLKALSILIAVQMILPLAASAQGVGGGGAGGASGGANAGGGGGAMAGGNVMGGFSGGTATSGAVNSSGFAQPLNFNNTGTATYPGATGSFNTGNNVPQNNQTPFSGGLGQNMIAPGGLFNGNNLIPSQFRFPGLLGGSIFNSGAQFGALGTGGGGLGLFGGGGGGGMFDSSGIMSPLAIPGMQINATMLREGGPLAQLMRGEGPFAQLGVGASLRMKDAGRSAGGLGGNIREYGARGAVARANARLNMMANAVAAEPTFRRAVVGARGLVQTEESVRGTIIQNSILEIGPNACPAREIVGPGAVIYTH
jgi:hypothetical protein